MTDLRTRLDASLRSAIRQRDRTAVRALRSALSAIANAEAVNPETVPDGATEVSRRELAGDDLESIVAGEISERRVAAERYRAAARAEPAELLDQEADLLDRILRDG